MRRRPRDRNVPSVDRSRRALLAGAAVVASGVAGVACARKGTTMTEDRGAALVAYPTRSGNTRTIAEGLSRMTGARIAEVRPVAPYPADYQAHVDQAQHERDAGIMPAVERPAVDLASFRTLYLGFPIWGSTVPQVLRSFLALYDWRDVTVRPFITHGGYGTGDSRAVLSRLLPHARIETPFVLEMDQERRTLEAVRTWLGA